VKISAISLGELHQLFRAIHHLIQFLGLSGPVRFVYRRCNQKRIELCLAARFQQ
jgi:hypothetical protein